MIARFCIITIDFEEGINNSLAVFNESKEKQLYSKAQNRLQATNIGYKILKHGKSKFTIFAVEPGSKIEKALFINEENLELGKLYYYKIDDFFYVAKFTENGWSDIYLPLDDIEFEMLPEMPTLLTITEDKHFNLTYNNLETEKFIKIGLIGLSAIILLTTVFQIISFKLDQSEIDSISIEAQKRVTNYNQAYAQVVEEVKNIKRDNFEMSNKIVEISKICPDGIVKSYVYSDKSEDLIIQYDIISAKKADTAIDNLRKAEFEVTSSMDKQTDKIVISAKRKLK